MADFWRRSYSSFDLATAVMTACLRALNGAGAPVVVRRAKREWSGDEVSRGEEVEALATSSTNSLSGSHSCALTFRKWVGAVRERRARSSCEVRRASGLRRCLWRCRVPSLVWRPCRTERQSTRTHTALSGGMCSGCRSETMACVSPQKTFCTPSTGLLTDRTWVEEGGIQIAPEPAKPSFRLPSVAARKTSPPSCR